MKEIEEIKFYLRLLTIALVIISAIETVILYSIDFKIGFYIMMFATVMTALSLAFKDVFKIAIVGGVGTTFGFPMVWILLGYVVAMGISGLIFYASLILAIVYDIVVTYHIFIANMLYVAKELMKKTGYPQY